MCAALVLSALLAPAPGRDPAEQAALAALEKVGFEEGAQMRQHHVVVLEANLEPPGKQWPPLTAKGLARMAELRHLGSLQLPPRRTTDEHLSALPDLPELRTLILQNTRVTDAGLKNLTRYKKLSSVYLGRSRVTDHGLKTLAGLPALIIRRLH